MMNYDMQQALCGPPSATNNNNNNPNRVSPHLYYQQQHHPHQLQHHRLKNEPFSPPISHGANNIRSSINNTNSSPNHPMSKTPIPPQQRSIDYTNSSPCPEPSLKHARFDPPIWPNTT
jgi:hypothetical protein